MKSHEFLPEAHLTDPLAQPKPAAKMKPRKKDKGLVTEEIGWVTMVLAAALFAWYHSSRLDSTVKVFKVYVNGKDVSTTLLSKDGAVKVIRHLASEEHNPETYYTILDTRTNKIVFRHKAGDPDDE